MKPIFAAFVINLALCGAAAAQNQPTSTSPTPPAVAQGNGDSNTTAAPVAGANSFTEMQARNRLEKHGYTAVSSLKQDDKSVWRGAATKNGKSVQVAVDYQGNIVAQ